MNKDIVYPNFFFRFYFCLIYNKLGLVPSLPYSLAPTPLGIANMARFKKMSVEELSNGSKRAEAL
ncbi:hypothetical protein IscW_ISCW012053 [Ixodes scapularis]|uniref:Uncharacterized protein n=1 Tax=Ixodes scapularis TaxID=6945 RepID=B7QDI6_IXOSC|nr:hypothetical protein IscW_ISCW012053 [Ixodes scapularis]|eukprot:XP_002413600.1 hypothetical protein IscW_ISCW012053 [Ixodes scapularis]